MSDIADDQWMSGVIEDSLRDNLHKLDVDFFEVDCDNPGLIAEVSQKIWKDFEGSRIIDLNEKHRVRNSGVNIYYAYGSVQYHVSKLPTGTIALYEREVVLKVDGGWVAMGGRKIADDDMVTGTLEILKRGYND